ncbi:MAG: nicotinate phosphoribosyltransferase [Polyangiaceae bacterium]
MANQTDAPIVRSLLENDLYKFTMWQALLHSHPGASAEYKFVCRSAPQFPLTELLPAVERELGHLCTMQFEPDELDYLRGLRFLKADFVDFLSVFRFQRRFIELRADGDTLSIVAKGPLVHVMGFEIFVLYIVSELYSRRLGDIEGTLRVAEQRLEQKLDYVCSLGSELGGAEPFVFFDFGLRRRHSALLQDRVVERLASELPEYFRGTSNVFLAKRLKLVPIGTMAHEYLQAYQAFGSRLRDFQKAALEGWVQEFRGDLGIALTDVVGMGAFLRDFDLYFAKLFDGLRHDSGDPVAWGESAIEHYRKLRIDPRTRRLVFSDSLDLPRAVELFRHFHGRTQTAFGIGTNLSNDTPHKPLNLVMKIVSCDGQPVAKLSDSPGKTLCTDQGFVSYLRQVFGHTN